MTVDLADQIDAAVARVDFGKATARKTGRNPKWPYVPIIDHSAGESARVGVPLTRTEQIRKRAFATRAEAIYHAEQVILARGWHLKRQLADPRMRALREQHGLPRDI